MKRLAKSDLQLFFGNLDEEFETELEQVHSEEEELEMELRNRSEDLYEIFFNHY